ncbi:MAG: alkaline phosphatase [Bacteroidales bacterium]|nr:alkaline phosphatase [Bacteroidales bacterium]MBK7628627.1 alkaline phosphatase [Bacteroidales bacterium]
MHLQLHKIRRISLSVFLTVLSVTFITCTPARYSASKKQPEIRNVILMIGDGMGLATMSSAITVSDHPLNITRCKTIGLQKTSSANKYITDSAAAGTALATGNKTNNGVIGMDSTGVRVKSILEIAEENGLATGLVSTSSVTHATPASFIAHQESRGSYEDIALDFLKTDVDVLIGGGYDHFAKRKDNLNLIDSLKARGYEVMNSMNQVLGSTSGKIAGLVAPVHTPYRLKGRGEMLPQSSSKAIEILSKNKKGFFLMIEGSQIDWAGHANAADTLVDETIDFDNAVGKVLDFAEADGHTLVIITADHETGGVTITDGDIQTHKVKLNFSSKDHTPILIPVFAFGPGSENFNGIYENTEIFQKIRNSFRFDLNK